MSQHGGDDRSARSEELTLPVEGAAAEGRAPDRDSRAGASGLEAGRVVGGRYRIVSLLGRGGMGEVYRADDLELGMSVALKFLPIECAGDPVRRERLRSEVRVARQVSHPNVCRVYDIGQADGRPFLTMEFIDGEDLASLLRRIGRLPRDKALELARQICAGVAAAHEHDVVHRDLKPANVMVDGRGRARVSDFGLAGVLEDLRDQADPAAGTPAYMAPEQLAGKQVTSGSDIYALGLVLYELFTGKPAHRAETLGELRQVRASSTPPTSPSELVEGMDAAVERVIMRCLEADPRDRPASALAVMAALPGGDPLTALLEAGETPSPELVAASGRRGILSVGAALRLAVVSLVGAGVTAWMMGSTPLGEIVGGLLPPEVLEHRSREILRGLSIDDTPADTAWGYDVDPRAQSMLAGVPPSEARALLRSTQPPVVRFWYRAGRAPLSPWRGSLPGLRIGDEVTPEDPPLTEPGMVLVRLGPRGRLLELRRVPDQPVRAAWTGVPDGPLVSATLRAAGVAEGQAEQVEAVGPMPMPASSTTAWTGPDASGGGETVRVEAAFAGARPTWVSVLFAGEAAEGLQQAGMEPARSGQSLGLVFFLFFAAGASLALLNVRTGRWDRRGATRLAVAVFVLCLMSSLVFSHHTFTATEEARRMFSSVAYAATRALMTWLLYVAMEPFIRRLHPASLVSWSRLLSGRVTDPAVGRDVLFGVAAVAVQGVAIVVWFWARGWDGALPPSAALAGGQMVLTARSALGVALRLPALALGYCMSFLLCYALLRSVLGRVRWAAPTGLWLLTLLLYGGAVPTVAQRLDSLAVAAIIATAVTIMVVRHGLLSVTVVGALTIPFSLVVVTVDSNDWYFAPTAMGGCLLLALVVFGVWASTAGALAGRAHP